MPIVSNDQGISCRCQFG